MLPDRVSIPEPLTYESGALPIALRGLAPSQDNVLVVVDYYSIWYEFVLMKYITSLKIINCLYKMFTTHGLPFSITCDNAPQLVSQEMKKYLKDKGIEQIFFVHHIFLKLMEKL